MQFREDVRSAIGRSTAHLVFNADEMWRRQMRDDGARAAQLDPMHGIECSVADVTVSLQWGQAGDRARAVAAYGSWTGPWTTDAVDAQGAFSTLQGLKASAGTYREFDAWQLHASGRRKRGRGVLKAPRPRAQNCRSDAPPGHRKGKTLITICWANGVRGPTVCMYAKSGICKADVLRLNAAYAPELFIIKTQGKSHMNNGQLFIWYLDVVVREALRQQRAYMQSVGLGVLGRRMASLIVDRASCHYSLSRGQKLRRDAICDGLGLELILAPAGYSAVGQPCDAMHRSLQAKEDRYIREAAGRHLDVRRRPGEVPTTSGGAPRAISTSQEVEII